MCSRASGLVAKGVGVLALLMLIPCLIACHGRWHYMTRPTGGWRWAGGLALFLLPIPGWLVPMLLTARADGDPQHRRRGLVATGAGTALDIRSRRGDGCMRGPSPRHPCRARQSA